MDQARILSILYDTSLVMGAADQVQSLLLKVLQRLIFHTGYPCGLILQRQPDAGGDDGDCRMRLRVCVGDHRLNAHLDTLLSFPAALADGDPDELEARGLEALPLRHNYYRRMLRLPVPDYGVMLLLTPVDQRGTIRYPGIFKPVLANFSKAITLCERNEAYTRHLIADRDAAREANERFRHAMDSSQDAIYLIDPEAMRFLDFNHQGSVSLGYAAGELSAMGPQDIKPDVDETELRRLFERAIGGEEDLSLNAVYRRKDGSLFPVEVRINALRQEFGKPVIIAVARDVTERKAIEEALFKEKERAQVTLQSIGDAVITTDQLGRIDYMNPVAEALTGYACAEAKGWLLEEAFQILEETTRQPVINPVDACLACGEMVSLANHSLLISRDGREIAIEDSAAPIRRSDGAVVGVVMVFHDVTRAREMAHKLSWQASHDSMTGLVNRAEFERRLALLVKECHLEKARHALLYIDLDQFKVVNDTCGHVAGDELLKQLAVLMHNLVRESDTLARLGGDEFGVLLCNCDQEHSLRVADALREQIRDYRFVWREHLFEVGASIGIVEINEDQRDISLILSQADMACYAAKDAGRNRVHIFEANDDELMRRHSEMLWVSKLTEAMGEQRLELFWQEIRPLQESGTGCGYEVLLRLRDAQGRLILPGAFIPAAERYNLMPVVDRWVIGQVFAFCREWCERSSEMPVEIFINLSGASINHERTSDFILEQLRGSGLDAGHFCFELTETAAISNLTNAYRLIRELKKEGFRFALDDFGAGVSSFTYLKNLPVDYLKIDGSFVLDMLRDPVDESMVQMINQIGHVMGLKTIAEYVESAALCRRLTEMGIDFAQGFVLHKPVPMVPDALP